MLKDYRFTTIIKFALPSIIMQIFLSLYSIVDGMFVTKVDEIAIGSLNIIWPITSLEIGISIMIGSGGAALVSKINGEGNNLLARKLTTFLFLISISISLIFSIIGLLFIKELSLLLNASFLQLPYCVSYGRILIGGSIFVFSQTFFQSFLIAAGKPKLGLIATLIAGIMNMLLDYIFIGVFKTGVEGAAIATLIGQCLCSLIGFIYFLTPKCSLHFTKPVFDFKLLTKALTNGSSEMVTNLANGVTTYLFNIMFYKYFLDNGVSSITLVLYFQFTFASLFFGYSMAVSPLVAYSYGKKDFKTIKQISKKSFIFVILSSIAMYAISLIIIKPLLMMFTPINSELFNLTKDGFILFAISFLFMGFSIFASNLFTALQNGVISALISFVRTFLFLTLSIILLPKLINETGLWLSVPLAEFLGLLLSLFFIIKYRKRYNLL